MKLNKSGDEIFIFYDPLLVTASLSDVSANLSQSRQHFLVAFSINRAPRQYLSSCTNINFAMVGIFLFYVNKK